LGDKTVISDTVQHGIEMHKMALQGRFPFNFIVLDGSIDGGMLTKSDCCAVALLLMAKLSMK
jgi:hypothetical protein